MPGWQRGHWASEQRGHAARAADAHWPSETRKHVNTARRAAGDMHVMHVFTGNYSRQGARLSTLVPC